MGRLDPPCWPRHGDDMTAIRTIPSDFFLKFPEYFSTLSRVAPTMVLPDRQHLPLKPF